MPQVQRPASMDAAVGAGTAAARVAACWAGACWPGAGAGRLATDAAVAAAGAGEVETSGVLPVALDEALRLRRTASVVSRMVWRTTTFCGLNRMTSSLLWTSAPPTKAPT